MRMTPMTLGLLAALIAMPAVTFAQYAAPVGSDDDTDGVNVQYQSTTSLNGRHTSTYGSDGTSYQTTRSLNGRHTTTTGSNGYNQTCTTSLNGRHVSCY